MPGWINASGNLISPDEAKSYYQFFQTVSTQNTTEETQVDAAEITDEIAELARALKYDPILMYEYVRNHVDYVPYYGSLKGAEMTFLEGSGNDFDQASLLIALFRESGFTAKYVYGLMLIPSFGDADKKDMQHWLSTSADNTVISTILANGGIPATEGSSSYWVCRVWVQTTISGTTYLMDPAFKSYEETSGVDLKTAMGYDKSTLLGAAGGTLGDDYIEDMDEAGLQNVLSGYSSNLVNHIRGNYPNAHMDEIIGGRKIIPEYLDELPTSLEFTNITQGDPWDDIPSEYAHTVQIQHGGINETLNIAALSGKRLSITYHDEGEAETTSVSQGTAHESPAVMLPQSMTGAVKELSDAVSADNLEAVLTDLHINGLTLTENQADVAVTNTDELKFGKIAQSQYSQTGTLSATNGYLVTVKLIIDLSSNPSGAFSIVSGGGTNYVASGASHGFIVRFSGSDQSAGTKSGTLRLRWYYEGALLQKNTFSLTGEVAKELSISGSGMSAAAYLDNPVTGTCRLMNNGTEALRINSMSLSGSNPGLFQFVGGNGSGTIAAGEYRDIEVSYLASALGSHDAVISMSLTYDDITYSGDVLSLVGETLDTPVAQLWLDDELIAEESTPVNGTSLGVMTLTIDHPYSAPSDEGADLGTYCDQTVEYNLTRNASYAYTIIYGFGGSRMGRLLEKRRYQLQAFRNAGYEDDSRQVLTEALNVIGMTWMRDTTLNKNLLAKIADVRTICHHRFGVVAQESGYYIDVKAQSSSQSSASGDTDARDAFFKTISHLASAMEHGVLEQMQVDQPSVSTVKLLGLANASSDKIFYVTSENFSTIETELNNYSNSDLEDFQEALANGRILILPANGSIELEEWAGKGYIEYKDIDDTSGHCGMIIGGDYYGGYSALQTYWDIGIQTSYIDLSSYYETTDLNLAAGEPVDMVTGAWMHDHIDLALSGGAKGLSLSRSYYSDNNNLTGPMGYGWSHSYNLYAQVHSNSEFGLGRRTPVDAAALISASVATLDLMSDDTDLKDWMTAALTGKWAMDQLTDNAVSVHLGTDVLTYIKLPDGSFGLPPGVNSELVTEDGLFQINERFDRIIAFNSDNQVSAITDADGNRIAFTYNDEKLQSVADDFGHTLSFAYTNDLVSSVTDSAGRSVSYAYDGNDNLTTVTDVEGKAWTYGYDGVHRVLAFTDPLAVTTVTNVYNDLGRVQSQIMPRQEGTATYQYYFAGYRNAEQDPDGRLTVYKFDEFNRLVGTQDALGNETSHTYDGQNHVIQTTDPRGNITLYEYDGNNNLIRITDALGNETVNTYDNDFHLTDVTDPLGNQVHYDFNSQHHLEKTTVYPASGQSIETSSSFYSNGLPQTTTDGRGVVTTLTWDTYGNPDTTQTASAPAIDYDYNGIGLMTSLTDQKSQTTSLTYDNRGLLGTRTDPLGKSMSMAYYDDGKIRTITDRNSHTVTYTYTDAGKVDAVSFPDGTSTAFTYNNQDNLTQMTDASGTTAFVYDALNRLTSRTDANGFTVAYTYDEAGNLATLTYPGSKTVTYTYDALNRLSTVTDWLDRTATYHYDDAGRLDYLTQFNGTVVEYSYDNANRLTGLANLAATGGNTIASYAFTLDGNGNRTGVSRETPLSVSLADAATQYTIGNADRLESDGTNTFTYDNEGQLATAYGNTLAFDYEHRLTGVSGADEFQYTYDGSGNRISAVRSGTETRYIYDASGNLLAEADSSGITRYYIYGAGLLAMEDTSGTMYCYHFDATGHTVAMTNSSKAIVNAYAYTPFGTIGNQQETVTQPFKFVGQYGVMTEDNGWYYMRARYYDPETHRFISQDPMGFDGGDVNLYAYVSNNPVMFTDPSGELINFGAAGVGAVIGGAVGAVNALFNNGDVLQGAAYGAGVGALAGLSFGTSLIANSAIGATIGVGTDYLIQRRSNPDKEINVTSLVISGISGAIGGGAGAAALKGGASAIDAALVGGSLSGGVSTGLNYTTSPGPNMATYNPK